MKLSMEGVEEAYAKISALGENLYSFVKDALWETGEKIYEDLQADQRIPEKYKESLMVGYTQEDEIIIGPVWEEAIAVEKGRLSKYDIYKCPKLKYRGGVLRIGIEPKNYLGEYVQIHRESIIQGLVGRIKNKILGLLGV